MKILVNERQYKKIKDTTVDVTEETEPTDTTTTDSTEGGSSSYPEVGKWESGATRGPSNQIGNTKWSDTVGSTLKRDKANRLK